jgi:hypothetical protein
MLPGEPLLGRSRTRSIESHLYEVRCCAFSFLSNHFHLLLDIDDVRQLARVMGYVNSNLAREAGRLHGWEDKIWSRRYQAIIVSLEEGARKAKLSGALGSTGPRSTRHAGEGEELDRLRYATTETLHLSPVPCWKHLPAEVWQEHTLHLIHEIEEEAAARRSRMGSQPLGVAAIRGQHPHDRPKRPKRSPAPLFHAVSAKVRYELWAAYAWFVAAFREASEKLRAGDRNAAFPAGSFPPPCLS